MADFTLDTSGAVWVDGIVLPFSRQRTCYCWTDLDAFSQGYVEALFASLAEDVRVVPEREDLSIAKAGETPAHWAVFADGDGPLIDTFASEAEARQLQAGFFSDLSPEALAMILADCAAIQAPDLRGTLNTPDAQRLGGMNFWAERRDDNWTVAGFPPLTVSLGDDGKVHLTSGAA